MVVTLSIAGDIDGTEADQLVDEVINLARPEVDQVVLDLGAVTFLGSSGIAALIRASGALADRGVGFRIGRSTEMIDRVLEIVGVADRLANESPA